MFAYPHARSTYTLSKETGFCFLSFSFQNQASKSCQGESNSCGFNGHSFQSRIFFNVSSQRKGICSPKWEYKCTYGLCIIWFDFRFFLFHDSIDFKTVNVYLNTPYFPSSLNMKCVDGDF